MGAAVEYEPMQRLNGGEEKILVSVRLRPLNEKETATNDISEWECINENTIVSRNSLSASERSMYPSSYTFDRVFGPGCSTRQVYGEGAKEVALCGLRGIHSSVFAYGQTSSGKTYTMGGITEYAVADIFEHVNKHKEREFVLKFSAIEIYNESVRDLLSTDPSPLRLLDDPEKGTVVERLIEETIRSWNHFKELLSFCQAQRQVGETNLNETSSRSHQILRLTIESSARVFDRSSALAATVNFIDLAGSERASQSHAAGTRLKEGCHINRSLLTLGTVIRKLSKGRNGHIPYRDSKLTRILQSSLGGNARTAIICTMSPARMHVEQSRNTLLFASCAKEVTTNAQVNVVISDKALVKQLKRELTRLENELKSKGMKMVPPDVAEVMREKDREIDRLKKEMAELTRQLNYAQAQVEDLLLADDRSSSTTWVDQYNHYPKLRVRDSVRSEHSTSYSSLSGTTQFVYASFGSFDASVSTDRRSTSSTEDNFTQFTDLDERFLQQNSSPEPSIISGNLNQNDEHHEDIEEPIKEDTQNNCKEVECIQVEEPFEKRYSSSALAGSSPTKYAQSYPSSPSINTGTSGVPEVDQDDGVKTQFESLTIEEHKVSAHSYVSSPDINTGTSEVIEVAHDDGAKQKLESSKIEEHKELISESILPSSQQPSPLPIEFGSSNLVKSRSCTARDLSKSMLWYPELERAESAPLVEFERCFEQRSEGLKPLEFEKPGRSEYLKYDQDAEKSSGNDPQTPVENTADDDLKEKTLETVTDSYTAKDIEESSRNNSQIRMENTADDDLKEKTIEVVTDCKTSTARESEAEMISGVSDTEEESEPDTDSGLELEPVQESEPEPISSKNSVKWIRLDSIRLDDKKSSTWPLEFKKLQREIINLWHACNISLIHRTYFFMIYNGDPVDSFYMHLEMKRISFLKHVFSKGTKTMVNGEIVTPGSSKRALNEERQMLSRQMLKRLTKDERENLFLRWGITLNSNNRRMQLANRLWSKTDLDHVTECTTLVAKLIGFKQNEKPMKEMFGLLNFTPKRGRKTSLWKFGGLSFL